MRIPLWSPGMAEWIENGQSQPRIDKSEARNHPDEPVQGSVEGP